MPFSKTVFILGLLLQALISFAAARTLKEFLFGINFHNSFLRAQVTFKIRLKESGDGLGRGIQFFFPPYMRSRYELSDYLVEHFDSGASTCLIIYML